MLQVITKWWGSGTTRESRNGEEEAVKVLCLILQDNLLIEGREAQPETISMPIYTAIKHGRIMDLVPSTMGEHIELTDWMAGEMFAIDDETNLVSGRFVDEILECWNGNTG